MSWMARCFIPRQIAFSHRLGSCYDWHKLVWTCFPGRPDARRDFLFRLDARPEGTLLHILGEEKPERLELCLEETWECRKIPSAFLEHDSYRFDVICNPGRKVAAYDADGARKKNSRREAIIHRDGQEVWFLRKAQDGGFSLGPGTLRIDPCQTHHFNKKESEGINREGTHIGARFCGALHVQDKGKFRKAFCSGIGGARGFGFGLLLLAPLRGM